MAKDLNVVTLVGRLGKDPELKQTKNGVDVIDFNIANNQGYGDTERVNWISCRAYKNIAKVISDYCTSGSKLIINGVLNVDQWQDDSNQTHSRTYVLVTEFYFGDSKGSNTPAAKPSKPVKKKRAETYDSYEEFDDSVF